MPTYEYACASCGNHWEEMQKISEPAIEICPKCQQHSAKRQISGGRFILKGGGWYADLYSSVKPGAKKDSGGESGGGSGSSSSSGGTKDSASTAAPAATATSTSTKAAE